MQAHGPPSMMRMAAAQTRRTKRLVTNLTFVITLLLYLACGVGGYYRAPGGMPAPNVLDSFRPTTALMVGYVALIFALSLSFPVMFMVARTHIYSLLRHDPDGSTWRVTGLLIVGGLGVAIGFPSIEAALGLLGATCSVSLSFVIPALLYKRLVVKRDAATGERIRQPRARQAYGLIAFGVLAAALSIPVQLWEIIGEQATPQRQNVARLQGGIPVRTFPRVPSINSGVIFGIIVGVILGACVSSAALYLCCIRGKAPRSPPPQPFAQPLTEALTQAPSQAPPQAPPQAPSQAGRPSSRRRTAVHATGAWAARAFCPRSPPRTRRGGRWRSGTWAAARDGHVRPRGAGRDLRTTLALTRARRHTFVGT